MLTFPPTSEDGCNSRVLKRGKTETVENWLLKCFSDIIVLDIVLCTAKVLCPTLQMANRKHSDLF